jgi:hypothetical protein
MNKTNAGILGLWAELTCIDSTLGEGADTE